MKQPPIVIVFDDLYPGGLFTLNATLWKAYTKIHTTTLIVIAGIGFDQRIYNNTFSFAHENHTYRLPKTNQVYTFFLVFFHTVRLLMHIPADATIVANNAFSGFAASLFCLITHKKFIYFYHGSLYREMTSLAHPTHTIFSKIRRFGMSLFYWTIQYLTIVFSETVCFSQYARSLIKKHFGIHKHVQILSIPFSHAPASIQQKQDAKKMLGFSKKTKLILFPSRIEPRKGLHILIQALKLLWRDNLFLVVAGPLHGESVEYLTSITQYDSPHIHKHVYLTGEINPKDMHMFFKAADVTVVPSMELETLGLVTLESLSNGTPVIGFSSGHTPYILKAIHPALIAKQKNPQSLARTIHLFFKFSDTQKRVIQKQIGRYLQAHHSQETSLRKLQDIFY